jgi:hypothetical protein
MDITQSQSRPRFLPSWLEGLISHTISVVVGGALIVTASAHRGDAQTGGYPGLPMRRGLLNLHYVWEHSSASVGPGATAPRRATSKSWETLDAKINFEAPNLLDPNALFRSVVPAGIPQPPNLLKYSDQNGPLPFYTSAGPGRILSIEATSAYSSESQVDAADFHETATRHGSGSGLNGFGLTFIGDSFSTIDATTKPFSVTVKTSQWAEGHPELRPSTTNQERIVVISFPRREARTDGSLGEFQSPERFSAAPWAVEVTHASKSNLYKGTGRYHHRATGKSQYDPSRLSTWVEDSVSLDFTFDLSGHGG